MTPVPPCHAVQPVLGAYALRSDHARIGDGSSALASLMILLGLDALGSQRKIRNLDADR